MARLKKIVSRLQDMGEKRAASLRSISPTLDLGNGLTLDAYQIQVNQFRDLVSAYNQALSHVDNLLNQVFAAEKTLADWNERMLAGIASRFGKDSSEYEKAGGKRKSERKRPTRRQNVA